jgi:hypothetical protein
MLAGRTTAGPSPHTSTAAAVVAPAGAEGAGLAGADGALAEGVDAGLAEADGAGVGALAGADVAALAGADMARPHATTVTLINVKRRQA